MALNVHVDFARFPCAAKWTQRFCCYSVFKIVVVFLNIQQSSRLICMLTRLSVAYRNHIRRSKSAMKLRKCTFHCRSAVTPVNFNKPVTSRFERPACNDFCLPQKALSSCQMKCKRCNLL